MVNAAYSFGGKTAAITVRKPDVISLNDAGKTSGAGNTSSKNGGTFADKLNKAAGANGDDKVQKHQAKTEDTSKEDASKENASKEDASKEAASKENIPREISSDDKSSQEVSSKEEVSSGDEKVNATGNEKTSDKAGGAGLREDLDEDELKSCISDFVDILTFMAQLFNMSAGEFVDTVSRIDMAPEEIVTEEGIKKVILTVNNGKDDLEFLLNPEMAKQLKDAIEFLSNFPEEEIAYVMKALQDDKAGRRDTIWNHVLEAYDGVKPEEHKMQQVAEGVYDPEKEDDINEAALKTVKSESVPETANAGVNADADAQNTGGASDGSGKSGKQQSSEKGVPEGRLSVEFMENIRTSFTEALGDDIAPERSENIMRQIIEQVRVSSKEDMASIQISLTPESLGKVEIHVVSKDGAVTAQISVETEAARKAVESQIMTLRETFDSRDIKVDAVEVTIASHQYENNGGNDGRGRQEQIKKGVRRINPGKSFLDEDAEEAQPESEMSNDDRMILMGSTVSYSA